MTSSGSSVRVARRIRMPSAQTADLAAMCAAVLATSAPDSVIVSVTAARLRELWLPPGPSMPIHVATATPGTPGRSMTRTRRPEFVAHRFQLRPQDIEMVAGVPVTSLARTFCDVARLLELPDLVALGDSALRAGATSGQLAHALDRWGPGRGCNNARKALSLLDKRSRSRPESHLRVAASGLGLPRFEVNEPVGRREGGWLAEPDLSLAEARIALEYQGAVHADVERKRADITRATDLRQEDWLVIEYGPAQVFGRPWQIAPELRRYVAARAPHLLR